MPSAKILIVDDEPAILNLIQRFLSKQSEESGELKYQVESAKDSTTALIIFEQFNPDLVILDVNLPDGNGYLLCEEMQRRTGVFVLMLTSRTDSSDKVTGFSKGADDYFTKPFDLEELKYRVEAILKRQRMIAPSEPQCLRYGGLAIDPVRREVTLDNQLIGLTALEFNLLYFLASEPGRVWQRSELIEKVWKFDYVGNDQRVVDVHIGQIRKKIEENLAQPSMIHTVRGVGYKFELTSIGRTTTSSVISPSEKL